MKSQSFEIESTTNSHFILNHNYPKLCLITNKRVDFLESKEDIQTKHFIMNKLNAKISIKSNKRILSPTLISLVLIIHITSNQSLISILEAGRELTSISSINLAGNNSITNSRRSSNSGLINFASAEPAPLPASVANPQASTSRSHRGPPMNGSMFGKRGVDKVQSIQKNQQQQRQQQQANSAVLDYIAAKNRQNFRTQADNYNDIITEIIENFLASNNENDPEEATAGFCRMIVYECTQMLSARDEALARRRKKKLSVNLAARSV